MALGASGSAVVARGPADATDADLEAQWAAQLAVLGLSLDMAQSMGVVLVHRVRFFRSTTLGIVRRHPRRDPGYLPRPARTRPYLRAKSRRRSVENDPSLPARYRKAALRRLPGSTEAV
jgi:hypothetical protein